MSETYKNFQGETEASLRSIATGNTTRILLPGKDYLPVTGKVLDADDLLYAVDASLDGWLTTGRFGEQFEKEIAAWVGSRWAYLVNSGSSANLVAFYALTS